MKNLCLTGLLALGALLVIESSAPAQAPPGFGRSNRPVTSPYLNLLRNRNQSPALNYYRSYLPETEFRNFDRQASTSLYGLKQDLDRTRVLPQAETSVLGTTGHPTSFGNTGNYFPGLKR